MGSVAYNPPEGKDYKWYISGIYLPIGGLYATYHLLREPETTIEYTHYGSMGLVYFPTWMVNFYDKLIGAVNIPYMDPGVEI